MPRFLLSTILLIVFSAPAFAQNYSVNGSLKDRSELSPISDATVQLRSAADSTIRYSVVSDRIGNFLFQKIGNGSYILSISSVGYSFPDTTLTISGADLNLRILFLQKEAKLLGEVVVTGINVPVRQKADTLEYNSSAFKVNPDANAEEMIRKMPGVTVEGGTVKAGGEDVRKVTVDGREFFGDDATAALRNLPAEVIDKIQVFDRLSDQAQFTGFDDGNTAKAINIVTKANMRNGQFGRVYAGYGTDERYSAGGNMSFFNGNRRLSLVGLFNNVNQQNFATEDLLGVTSSGGRGGGRGRGGPGGGGRPGGFGGGNTGNFMVGQQGGISKTNAFGLNFSDLWGKKLEVSGSYFFNNSNNLRQDFRNQQNFLSADSIRYYDESAISSSENFNHRLNMRLEYKIDSANTLLITPSLSFQKNSSLNLENGSNSFGPDDMISRTANQNRRLSSGYNFNNGILYRHSFKKRGRTISLSLNTGINNREGETYIDALNQYYKAGTALDDSLRQYSDQLTNGISVSTNIAYTEPIGKKSQLQFNYNPSVNFNKADQQTFQFDPLVGKYSFFDDSLSNKFDNTYTRQNGGVTYRIGDRDNTFSVGLSYQQASLDVDQVFPSKYNMKRSFENLLPNMMYRAKISERSNIRIFYRTGTNAPNVNQLQDVINNNNPLFLSTGNPDLKQSYNHSLATRYQFTNTSKGISLFANLFLQKTDNYVANAVYVAASDSVLTPTVTLFRGSQISKPINLDGFWSLRSFVTLGMPLRFIKSNLNWNLGYNMNRTPGFINRIDNESKTHTYNAGLVLASNVSQYVDFTLSYSANFNKIRNSIQPQLNNDYFNHVAGFQLNLLSKNGWVFQNALNNQVYRGLTDGFNQNFWLWNMSAGKKFLKDHKGELRLSVFDLLKQNQSIVRTATESYIEDVQTQVLQQYFMLTFSYRLRNFGGGRTSR